MDIIEFVIRKKIPNFYKNFCHNGQRAMSFNFLWKWFSICIPETGSVTKVLNIFLNLIKISGEKSQTIKNDFTNIWLIFLS